MISFTYSFCMAMLHSFWQAALLLMLYVVVDKIVHRHNAPLAKRNFLYAAVATQLLLFVLTFLLYFFDANATGYLAGISQNISELLGTEYGQAVTSWIFGAYLFIIGYKLLSAMYSWFHFKNRYKSGLQKPSIHLRLFMESKANQFGIKRKIKLWLSHAIQTPVTFGFFKPVIILPVALLNNISTLQAETLILHELTHIRTNDYLLNWFLLAAETIFFFNPFVINLCKQIRLEREKHCDINVISFAYSPALYAETLLQAERIKKMVPAFQLAAIDRKKQLLKRIQFFTNEKIINKTLRFNIVVPVIGLLLLFLLSAAVLFQSGNSYYLAEPGADIHVLPFNHYIVSDLAAAEQPAPVITKTIAPELIPAEIKMQSPVIQNNKNDLADRDNNTAPPLLEESVNRADDFMALHVAGKENDAARQIIVKEEGSGSASVKVYYLSFEDGQWILTPEWKLTAEKIMVDSLVKKVDSLKANLNKIYPSQQ
ncbi:MAG: M56 family metallopeptidase [Ferruginibacter sp.]